MKANLFSLKPLLPLVVLLLASLQFAHPSFAERINIKGEKVSCPFYFREKPLPGWSFQDPKKYDGNQRAPNGKNFALDSPWYWNFDQDRLSTRSGSLFGYVDLRGELKIPFIYEEAGRFAGGYAIVRRSKQAPVEIIDRSGKVISTLPSNLVPRTRSNMGWNDWDGVSGHGLIEVDEIGRVGPTASRHGIYSIFQNRLIPTPKNFRVEKFYDGMAKFYLIHSTVSDNLSLSDVGFMNTKGEIVIAAKEQVADKFSNGRAPVFSSGRWYYIDKTGKEVITLPDNCTEAIFFSEGLAAIALHQGNVNGTAHRLRGDQWAFIDPQGKIVIPAKFYSGDGLTPYFSDGVCAVSPSGLLTHYFGYIDKAGNWLLKPRFKMAGISDYQVLEVEEGVTIFDKEKWLKNEDPYRSKLFKIFLNQNHLLGMRQESVEQLLGPSQGRSLDRNQALYFFEHGCTPGTAVEISYSLGFVTRYRYNIMPKDQWFDLFHPDKGDWL